MSADPVEAGRKGGSRRTPAQLAAAKRNGFQPRAARIAAAQQSGNYAGLTVSEAVEAITPEPTSKQTTSDTSNTNSTVDDDNT